ncbi:MAG TPA: glycerophosphodiester phosphodiesterase family protein [Smithella sp.]|nr:hypothetical protein [Smithella sp.]HNY50135.1 glycerophosphodiester phosphodiesterase family protein [Smithella sp.]HOG89548.1 glycerophosphodiester phosphodiesterase family protein [Smithella sp.]HOU49884.1 glycerophosphodiester phosphodiesterase family protein [Smithella sp.]HQG64612.1 glycerophosphodiester phosphodiesterase family protein [Smithella sp.]
MESGKMSRPYDWFKYRVQEGDEFTIIAHRGASAYYPENTIPSFEGAIVLGADMVELDVQLTSDKEVVVFHDEKISRCTNGRGRIADYTLASLKKLDAGSWFDRKFKNTKIPTLSDVLDVCKDRIAVNVEIKTEAVDKIISGGIEERCLKIVEQKGMKKHVVFSSFDPRAIAHLKQIHETVPVAVLFEKKLYGSRLPSEIVASLNADAFNCSKSELNQKWMADIQSHSIPVNIYTVNDVRNMKKFIHMGVHGIFTNKPDVLRNVWADLRRLRA